MPFGPCAVAPCPGRRSAVGQHVGSGVTRPAGTCAHAASPAAHPHQCRVDSAMIWSSSRSWCHGGRGWRSDRRRRGRPDPSHRTAGEDVSAFAVISTSDPSLVGSRSMVRHLEACRLTGRAAPPRRRDDHRRLHQRSDRLVDRDVDLLGPCRSRSAVQRREGADDGEHRRQRIAEADPHRAGGRSRSPAPADPADRLADRPEPGLGRPWAALTESRDVGDDDPRIRRRQRRVVEPEPCQHAGPKFSSTTSHSSARRRTKARSSEFLRSATTERLLRAMIGHHRLAPSTVTPQRRIGSPPSGASILITSAP